MNILHVTTGFVFLKEKCLWSTAGHYVGLETGTIYPKEGHRHCPQLQAVIRAVDAANQTGVYHLYADDDCKIEENKAAWKRQFVGCVVTVEVAHQYGEAAVYRCLELKEYFSGNELEIISPQPC